MTGEEWIAAVVESPPQGDEAGPSVVVWYDPATDKVLDIQVTQPGLAEAPALFLRVTHEPKAGPPRTPARVRVADTALADALRGNIGDVELVVGDISEARDMLASLGEYMGRLESEPEIPSELLGRMFAATAALYRARPWGVIPADEWISVACEDLGITDGALTVVGQAGESYGFLLCRTVDEAVAWMAAGERRERGEPAADVPMQFYMLSYDHADELDPEEVAEVRRQGWDVADPAAYPAVTVLDENAKGRLPTAQDLAGVTAVIDALAAMVRDDPDLAHAWDGDAVEWDHEVNGIRVRLMAPLDMPAPPANPADATLDILDDEGDVDDERFDRYRAALMTRLAERDEIPDETLAAAEMLVEFAAVYHRVTFGRITANQLEALLLETIPAELAVESNEAGRIVAAARELMRLVGEELASPAAHEALELLDDAFVARMVRELENPAKFTEGKQLVMAGIAAGFDMSTEEGVTEFVQAFAQSQRTAAKPKRTAKPKGAAKPKAKKPKANAKAKKPTANAKAKAARPKAARPKAKPVTSKAKQTKKRR